MTDLAAAGAAVSSLKTAFDLTKGFLDVQGTVKVQAKVIELQSQILAAQQSAMSAQQTQASLVERIKDLEIEMARLEEWGADQDRYRLETVGPGAFVYSPQAEPTDTEPNHWLCVKCFEGKHRSVLQNQGRSKDNQFAHYACPTCKTGFQVQWSRGPQTRGRVLADGSIQQVATAQSRLL